MMSCKRTMDETGGEPVARQRPVEDVDVHAGVAVDVVDVLVRVLGDAVLGDAHPLEETVAALEPDVLVKGGDYGDKTGVVGWEVVEGYGGEVRVLSLVENVSTTDILHRMQGKTEA